MEPVELETTRLKLRQWREADRAPFAALNADSRVMKHFPARLDAAASEAMVERCQALIKERGWGLWAVEAKEDGRFIGFVGLNIPTAELPFSPCVEIGWRLAFEAWGKGYATEAASAALRVGFERLALPEIVAFTALSNMPSQAVMGRLGMQRCPKTFMHPSVPEDSRLREHCLYRLSADQWARATAGAR